MEQGSGRQERLWVCSSDGVGRWAAGSITYLPLWPSYRAGHPVGTGGVLLPHSLPWEPGTIVTCSVRCLSSVPPSCFPSLCISELLQFLKRDIKKRQGLSWPEGKGTPCLFQVERCRVVPCLPRSWSGIASLGNSGRELRASGGKDLEPDVHWPGFPSWLKVGLTVPCAYIAICLCCSALVSMLGPG